MKDTKTIDTHRLKNLNLYNFRNYESFNINFSDDLSIIIGANGVGKTNILEALSLFAPGKGLRNAKLDDYANKQSKLKHWSVSSQLSARGYQYNLFTGHIDTNPGKRTITINKEKVRTHSQLADTLSIIWLTPQMDGIFLEGSSIRRKFMDRIVFNFNSDHAFKVNIYEGLLRERQKCLQSSSLNNNSWLDKIEQQLAEMAIIISKARHDIILKLLNFDDIDEEIFPKAHLKISGSIEKMLQELEGDDLYKWVVEKYYYNRSNDFNSNRNNFGPQRSDLQVIYDKKNIMANFCSTGEQKSLLISIIIAVINTKLQIKKSPPILLLDEIVAHLDPQKRQWLIKYLQDTKLQTFITSTDQDIFSNMLNAKKFIYL